MQSPMEMHRWSTCFSKGALARIQATGWVGDRRDKGLSAHLDAPQSYKLLTERAVRIEITDYEPKPKVTLETHVSLPREAVPR